MNRCAASLALWTAALVAAAPAFAQQVDAAASEIVFTTHMMGVPVEGRFTTWEATLQFDPRRPQAASLALRMPIAGIRFASAEVAAEAQRAVWFDAARFPQAQFQSTAVKPLGDERYEVSGRLTLKGQTRALVVPLTLARTGATAHARGRFTIERLDFDIGSGEWADASLVAPQVQVRFDVTLSGLPTP